MSIAFLFIGLSIVSATAQESCLNPESLKKIDASWEKAQLDADKEFLEFLLAEDFIWVHNHGNTIDNKTDVLNRADRYRSGKKKNARSRKSKDVKVIVSGTTGIVSGITIVDIGPSPTTYHFMRTYVEIDKQCFLIANQTMAVPKKA
jgi:hypothetical protein